MQSSTNQTPTRWKKVVAGILVLALLGLVVFELEKYSIRTRSAQNTFQSPADAGSALAKAAIGGDEAEIEKILGVDTRVLLSSGDQEADKAALQAFAAKYAKMNRWVDMTDGSSVLYIGADNFAFPVPLAKNPAGHWYFDGVAGAQEIRARDIGRNELLAIDACSAIASAQEDYLAKGGESPEYAQRIISTSGKQDGLYWPASEKQIPSPLANLGEFPRSSAAPLSPDQPLAVDGYSLRILTAQGHDAPGGSRSYIVDGKMTAGFAILATPVKYAETGIMTFMTGRDGVVYERDLGPDTTNIAGSIREFNPTEGWTPAE